MQSKTPRGAQASARARFGEWLDELRETGETGQHQWEEILGRFRSGGGELLDLEYLLDERGRRVAAFGYWAGFAGAALAVMNWCGQQLGTTPPLSNIGSWPNKNALCEHVKALLTQALEVTGDKPDIILIGAAGRVGGWGSGQ